MTITANITPAALTDGITYTSAVPLTPTEASLGDALVSPALIPVAEGQTIVAIVKAWVNGHIVANNSYIFLQTDLGDGVWVDVAWCRFTATDQDSGNPAIFVLCGGGIGAMNNAIGPNRRSSSAPATQSNGSNALPLGGRCRFTGFSALAGGSSSVAGTSAAVNVTITYRIQQPR